MAEENPQHGGPRPRTVGPSRQGSGAETGWAVTGTLISGMAVWGGVGWLLDRWLGILFFAPAGILLGTAVAIYLVVARYGAVDPPAGQRSSKTPSRRQSRPRGQGPTQKGQR